MEQMLQEGAPTFSQGLPMGDGFIIESGEKDKKKIERLINLYKESNVGKERLAAIKRCTDRDVTIKLDDLPLGDRKVGTTEGVTVGGTILLSRHFIDNTTASLSTLSHEMKHYFNNVCFPGVPYTKENEHEARLEGVLMEREYRQNVGEDVDKPSLAKAKTLGVLDNLVGMSIPLLAAGLLGVVFGFVFSSALLGLLVGAGLFGSYLMVRDTPPFKPVSEKIESLTDPINPFRKPYEKEMALISKDMEYHYPTITKGAASVGSYADLPTAKAIDTQVSQFIQDKCESGAETQECIRAVVARDELGRWRKEDIVYKKQIAEELKLSGQTIDEWISR